jgi:predicted O-methyltransferase YrrM
MARFSEDWFSHNIPQLIEALKLVGWNSGAPHTIVEIGCHEGRSSLWMLSNLLSHPESRLYSIDPFVSSEDDPDWGERHFDTYRANIAEHPDAHKVVLSREKSCDGLRQLLNNGVRANLIYVDGAHDAASVLTDLTMAYQLANIGALIVCDDYLKEAQDGRDILDTPKLAIDAFANVFRRKVKILVGQRVYQLVFQKVA